LGYILVADSVGLTSTSVTYVIHPQVIR